MVYLDPTVADAFFKRGLARNGKGDQDGAIADFNMAIEFNPNIANTYCNRGNARYEKGCGHPRA